MRNETKEKGRKKNEKRKSNAVLLFSFLPFLF
jgi:hypothetical protein